MNNIQLGVTAGLFVLLLLINQLAAAHYACADCFGGLPWYGWAGVLAVIFGAGLLTSRRDAALLRRRPSKPAPKQNAPAPAQKAASALAEKTACAPAQTAPATKPAEGATAVPAPEEKWNEELWQKYDLDGPEYPHPVIVAERCIGCHACVESCPHDVLTIGYTEKNQPVATVVDPDLCLEDTSCEAVCPVTPKACVVVNTAKRIRSLPTPTRDRSYMSRSVPGCYIIGDVSGTPLIKNAVNEGRDVIVYLANELRDESGGFDAPAGVCDVAIIGAGPAGLSAAVTAKRLSLDFVCIERDTVMSTIERAYSANKYVYFKPETMEWTGGIHLPGLEEYVEEVLEEFLDAPHKSQAADLLARERADGLSDEGRAALKAARDRYQRLVEAELQDPKLDGEQRALLAGVRRKFDQLLEDEERHTLARLLKEEAEGGKELWPADKARLVWARREHRGGLEDYVNKRGFSDERLLTLAQQRRKVAGDQKEVLLNTWRMNRKEYSVRVREGEACTSIEKAADGDYFVIQTWREKASEDAPAGNASYRARRVVIAIGKSSSPVKLREDTELKIRHKHTGEESKKVLYRLSDPKAFTGMNLIVVGGGNSAVEAAVDLASWRRGDQIVLRTGKERNEVTVLVRSSDFKTDVKFGNKRQLYQCVEAGLIKVQPNTRIVRICADKVVTENLLTGRKKTLNNDFIFALIGSEPKPALLLQMGVEIIE